MEFKEGADVYTADGEKAGEIEHVVIDPKTDEVTHIVVEKGFLFTEKKVVPTDLVEETTEDRITLRLIEDIDDLPTFEKEHYVRIDRAEDTAYDQPVYWYPPQGMTWWRPASYHTYPSPFGYPEPPFVIQTERQIPEGTVALEEGTEVITDDGERVGDVERVFADADSGRVSHFVISRGFLLEEEKVVPTTWVTEIRENAVYLAVGSGLIDTLPAYEEE